MTVVPVQADIRPWNESLIHEQMVDQMNGYETAAGLAYSPLSDIDVDVTTLLGADYDKFSDATSKSESGPIAVIGGPYSGREIVLDAATESLDAKRIDLDPTTDGEYECPDFGNKPVVIDNCQHLYTRRIGGFAPLDRFFDRLADTESTVITGWNQYAWRYLKATEDCQREFDMSVEVGINSPEEIEEAILGRKETTPTFVPDDPEESGLVLIRRIAIEWRTYDLSIPVPILNRLAVRISQNGDEQSPKELIFERLGTIANGNIGVAAAIWESMTGPQLQPSDIVVPETDMELDQQDAFCLRIILAKEHLTRNELSEIVGKGVDRRLGRLARENLVLIDNNTIRIHPIAVPASVAITERRRIL